MGSLLRYGPIFLVSALLWSGLSFSGLVDGLKQEALRWCYLARGERPSDAPLVFVNLDAATLSSIGDRPWDRRVFAVLADALLGPGGAKAVGIDLILSRFGSSGLLDDEQAKAGNERLGRTVERHADRLVLAAAYTGAYEDYDEEFSALRLIRDGYDDPTVIPFPEAPTFPILKWETGRLGLADVDESLNPGAVPYWVPAFVDIEGARYSLHLIDGLWRYWLEDAPRAEVVAEGDEFRLVDHDGFIISSLPKFSRQRLLTLGLELYLAANGLGSDAVERTSEALFVRGPDGRVLRRIPLARQQSLEVNWFNAWASPGLETHYSMLEVLEQANRLAEASRAGALAEVVELENWFARFRDKVVFVGPVDRLLKDVAPTPFNRDPVPKVGLHANIYRTIHDEAYVRRLSPLAEAGLTFLLTAGVGALALWSRRRGSALAKAGSVAVLLAYLGICAAGFSQLDLVLPLVAPVGSAVSATLLAVLVKLSAEEWQRRRIKSLFGTYLSPTLVDAMVRSGETPQLGGVEAEVTALFSDIEGFTGFSERLPPDRVVALMNEYLGAMTEIIQDEGGTLDKYVGDAIIAMFGMPVAVADHAARACRTAARMQRRHLELRTQWAAEGSWPAAVSGMHTRIGLNTGPAVIGNIGSRVRFNYTMMGDSVNLGARCETVAKDYGVLTIATEFTVSEALRTGEALHCRRLDRIVVKGREQPVDIFEIWDGTGSAEAFESLKTAYETALERYFAGEWEAALASFEAASREESAARQRTPSQVMAERCRTFIRSGGPADWDGAFRMEGRAHGDVES